MATFTNVEESEEQKNSIDLQDLMLFTTSQLSNMLRNKKVSVDGITERGKLLELHYKTTVPLPQREYYQNRRGKLLKKNQEELKAQNLGSSLPIDKSTMKLLPKKIKLTSEETSSTALRKTKLSPEGTSSSTVPKKIKLTSQGSSSAAPVLNRLSLTARRKSVIEETIKSLNGDEQRQKTPEKGEWQKTVTVSSNKRQIIRIINDTITSSSKSSSKKESKSRYSSSKRTSTSSMSKKDSNKEDSPSKKKHKPITWP